MIEYINKWNLDHLSQKISISIEIEKPKSHLEELLKHGDVLFIGKDFAQMYGYKSMDATIKGLGQIIKPSTILICAWGEKGASVRNIDGSFAFSSTYPPEKVIDTLGAGDTFVAATISILICKKTPAEAINFGCKVSGFKCGLHGFEGLNKFRTSLIN